MRHKMRGLGTVGLLASDRAAVTNASRMLLLGSIALGRGIGWDS